MATLRITSTASCRRRATGKLPTCWRVPRRRGKCWKSCERRASGWRERTGTCRSQAGGRRRGKFWPVPAGVLRRRCRRPSLTGQPEDLPGGCPGGCPGNGMFVRRSGCLGPRQVCCCWLEAVCGGGFSARRRRMNWHSQRHLKLQRHQLLNCQHSQVRQRPGRRMPPVRYCLPKPHRLVLHHRKRPGGIGAGSGVAGGEIKAFGALSRFVRDGGRPATGGSFTRAGVADNTAGTDGWTVIRGGCAISRR